MRGRQRTLIVRVKTDDNGSQRRVIGRGAT